MQKQTALKHLIKGLDLHELEDVFFVCQLEPNNVTVIRLNSMIKNMDSFDLHHMRCYTFHLNMMYSKGDGQISAPS